MERACSLAFGGRVIRGWGVRVIDEKASEHFLEL